MKRAGILKGILVAASLAAPGAALAQSAPKNSDSIFQACVDASRDMTAFRGCLADKGVPQTTIDVAVKRMTDGAAEIRKQQAAMQQCSDIGARAGLESGKSHFDSAERLYDEQAACWRGAGNPEGLADMAKTQARSMRNLAESRKIIAPRRAPGS